MEIPPILTFLVKHNETTIFVVLGLFLLTCILYVFRMAGDKSEAVESVSGVDLQSLENTLKRIVAQAQLAPAGGAATGEEGSSSGAATSGASTSGGDMARLDGLLAERDKKIAELQAALAAAKEASTAVGAAGGGGVIADDGSIASLELQQKVKELEARLAEYAIIEDDIADLSLYKEENQRLKAEVEEMRQKGAQMASAPAAVVEASAPAPVPAAAPETATAASSIPEPESPARPFEAAEKFGLDENDDVMKEFAAAVSGNATPAPSAVSSVDTSVIPAAAPAATAETFPAQARVDVALDVAAANESLPDISPHIDMDSIGGGADAAASAQAAIDSMLNTFAAGGGSGAMSTNSASVPEAESAAAAGGAENEAAVAAVAETSAEGAAESVSENVSDANDPLAGTLDTNKMLEEVASLSEDATDTGDALEDQLDTDKLLLEVSELNASGDGTTSEDLFGKPKDGEKNKG